MEEGYNHCITKLKKEEKTINFSASDEINLKNKNNFINKYL